MGITHKWTGSVLTITSDSGTSSVDLLGPKGDKGCRGPQGRAGCIVSADGTINMEGYATEEYVNEKLADVQDVDLSNYYTKAETDAVVENVEVDLTGYATETFVTTKIAAAQLEGADVDMSGYVTKDELNAVASSGIGKVGTGEGAEIFNNYSANKASGEYSHAEGNGTTASNESAHAEGKATTAKAIGTHAEGYRTTASGPYSHSEGYWTLADGEYQHVQGKFNIEDTNDRYAHIVGNGSNNNTRSNCHTLDWNGNAWFKGKVYVGGTSMDDAIELGIGGGGTSADLSNYYTKSEVEDLINNAITNLPVYNGEVI